MDCYIYIYIYILVPPSQYLLLGGPYLLLGGSAQPFAICLWSVKICRFFGTHFEKAAQIGTAVQTGEVLLDNPLSRGANPFYFS